MDAIIHHQDIQNNLIFKGELDFMGLADIFQILGGNNSTGILKLISPYVEASGTVFFLNGNPVNASLGSLQGIDAINALFGWQEGYFEFHRKEIHAKRLVEQSRMQIVLDALRMLDDGLIKKVGSPGFVDATDIQVPVSDLVGACSRHIIKGPLVDYMYLVQEEFIIDGDRIVTEGAYGNWVWVILEGRVIITRETSRGPMALAQLGKGSFIGTFSSFLFHDFMRTATATALGDVHLGLLDTQRLAGEFANLSEEFKHFFLGISDKLNQVSNLSLQVMAEKNQIPETEQWEDPPAKKGSSRSDTAVGLPSSGFSDLRGLHKDKSSLLIPFNKNDLWMGDPVDPDGIRSLGQVWDKWMNGENDRRRIEVFKEEYENLSRTLTNMAENLASCIEATANIAGLLQHNGSFLKE